MVKNSGFFEEMVKKCTSGALDVELSDYKKNKKLFTLTNLAWMIYSLKEHAKISELAKTGSIMTSIYFKALSDHFQELVSCNQTGAIHFACNMVSKDPLDRGHWILISVINLADKGRMMVIMDSMNWKISLDLQELEPQDGMHELRNLIEASDFDLATSTIPYILFFYDLFIDGNSEEIYQCLESELACLEDNQSENEYNTLDEEEAQRIKLAIASSMSDDLVSGSGPNKLKNNRKKKSEKKNGFHSVPDEQEQLRHSYKDPNPGTKGKEKA